MQGERNYSNQGDSMLPQSNQPPPPRGPRTTAHSNNHVPAHQCLQDGHHDVLGCVTKGSSSADTQSSLMTAAATLRTANKARKLITLQSSLHCPVASLHMSLARAPLLTSLHVLVNTSPNARAAKPEISMLMSVSVTRGSSNS